MHKKLYHASAKKVEARYQTIIGAFRRILGPKIPRSRQYWTLCSQQVSDHGDALDGSERHQLLKSGLISEQQFHGVDREAHVIELNSTHLPKSHWYCSDLYVALSKAKILNPSIVNCDLIVMPKNGAYLIGDVIALLTRRKIRRVMVVANFVLKSRYQKDVGGDSILEELKAVENFRYFFAKGAWKIYRSNQIYSYMGTGRSASRMGTIIFYRK